MYAVYNVFNNEATIKDSLLSIIPFVERVIALDGPYKLFPHKQSFSTDKTEEVCRRICRDKLIWLDFKKVWKSQVAKKNVLLKRVPKGEWFLRIASDETLHGEISNAFKFAESSKFLALGVPIKNFHPVWNGYKIKRTRPIGGHVYVDLTEPIPEDRWQKLKWKPYYGKSKRIIKKVDGTFFSQHHSRLYINSKVIRSQKILRNVLIVNHPQKIGWKRWHDKITYKRERYEVGDYEG